MDDDLLNAGSSSGSGKGGVIYQAWTRVSQCYQGVVDRTVPYRVSRWIFAVLLLLGFLARVLYAQAFLTPKIDPAMDFEDENGPELPTRANEEFRPFIRRLPEFKFWYSIMKSTLVAIVCTMFDCFNVPVFWPILVMYFITLFCITMKRQIRHMIKYRYLPFTHSKPKYQGHEDTGKVVGGSN